jgi:hypothetical protein
MYLVYIPRMRVQANVYYHAPPPAHPFFSGIHNVQQRRCLYRSNGETTTLGILQSRPTRDLRPVLGGEGGLYDHEPSKSNAF